MLRVNIPPSAKLLGAGCIDQGEQEQCPGPGMTGDEIRPISHWFVLGCQLFEGRSATALLF